MGMKTRLNHEGSTSTKKRRLFRDMSFRLKISILVFSAIFLPSVIMSTMTYYQAKHTITEQTATTVAQSITVSLSDIDSSLNAALSISNRALSEELLLKLASAKERFTEEEKATYYPETYQLLNYYISRIKAPNILMSIDSYYLYLPAQKTVITTNSTYYEDIDTEKLDFVHHLEQDGYLEGWYATQPVNYETLNGNAVQSPLITYSQPLFNDKGELTAVFALNLDTRLFDRLFYNSTGYLRSHVAICDREGNIIAAEGTADRPAGLESLVNKVLAAPKDMETFCTGDWMVVADHSSYTNFYCIAAIDKAGMLAQVKQTGSFLISMILISILLILVLAVVISRIFYKPLEKVLHAMQEIGNRHLDVRIDDDRQDEYRLVYAGFNSMAGELEQLIADLTTERLLNKTAQIKLLQEQINPHFLYNTLDSIYSISRLQNVPEISQMVLALSKFFRTSLSEGKDIVPLREAVSLVENYLTVQNIRFKGKFRFEVSAEDSLLDYRVPKLILQPFVENSIYHGIERKKDTGNLVVAAALEGEDLILRVSDDGVGMPEDKLRDIQNMLADTNPSAGHQGNFAIKNLNSQVKLRFGLSYGISITSEEGCGTTVLIRLPAIKDDKELGEKSLLPLS